MNLREKLENQLKSNPDRIAIQHKKDDEWIGITYREFDLNIRSLSSYLLEEGIKKGDKVGILLENSPLWSLAFFSLIFIGAIAVPIGFEYTEEEKEFILRNSGCKKVISSDFEFFKQIKKKTKKEPEYIEIEEDDLACILYTSGTTAEPKGAMLTHKNLLSNIDSLHRLNIVIESDSILSVLPLHHIYPLVITMLLPLLFGGKIIYPGSLRGEVLLESMRQTNPTVFVAVPQIFHLFHQKIIEGLKRIPFPFNMLLNAIAGYLYKLRQKTNINLAPYLYRSLHKKFGRSMRLFVSGGAKLGENVERDLFKFGFTISEGYGLTETSPVLTINPPEKPKIGSVGLAVPDVEVNLVNKDKKGIGEVIARGPNIMKGYYKREDLTKEAIKDGWFYTGDLGYFDEDGYLFLTGRSKEVIVLSSGLNINPLEIEEAYMKEAPLKEMCILEVPSRKEDEATLALWAIIRPDLEFFKKYGEVNLKSVIKERFDNVSKTLPAHKRIMGFSITLKELPRTLLGKIKRFEVNEIYKELLSKEVAYIPEAKELSEEDKAFLGKDVSKKIINYLKEKTKRKLAIYPDDTLELDLGIDSLDRIELATGLEKTFGIEIKDEILGSAFTVRDLIKGIEALLKESPQGLAEEEKEISFGPEYWKKLFEVLPKKENLAKIDLNPGFWTWLGDFLFILLLYLYFKIFHNLKVEGKENFPLKGPYMLYANHTSYYDGLVIAASFPRFPRLDLFFVGFRPYFAVPVIRNLIRIGRIIPLDFSSHLLEALRSSYYVLKNGKKLFLFPEGLRTLDGKIGQFKKGFGILIKESNVKVVPVITEGVFEAWSRTSKFPKLFHPVKVKFGKAINPEVLEKEGLHLGASDSYEAICIAARKALIDFKEQK